MARTSVATANMAPMRTASDVLAQRLRLLHSLSLATCILNRVLIAAAILFLLVLVLPYITDISKLAPLRWVAAIEQSMARLVRNMVPARMDGLSHSILLAGVFALSQIAARANERCEDFIRYYRFKTDYDVWKRENNLEDNAQVLTSLNQILDQLRTGKLKDREELLKIFGETKRKLDEISKNLAFLSIDVVDSTGMKSGEEKAAVEHDFKEYKRFVEGKLQSHGCLKTTWTPDGAMCCFDTTKEAVGAARDLISGLDGFNKQIKTMRRDFAVRCGINSGYVYFDDSLPLEEVSDRVIDITGHLQKIAATNGVCITRPALDSLPDQDGFTPSGKVVFGYEVYEWKAS